MFVSEVKRTHYCGSLTAENENSSVVLMGWVDRRRDLGGVVFVDLRDREGIVQVALDPQLGDVAAAQDVRNEFVIAVQGKVQKRPDGMVNSGMKTGEIEVIAEKLEILSEAQTPPFNNKDKNVSEALRLQYRYLDLRSERLHRNLRLRHEVTQTARRFLSDQGFLEVETPMLYKSTPEGARDFLVPSRVNPGEFFALPQSPQTLKQLLMMAGYDKYFQMARCFRDEDLRADRQPEFSQIDLEMSFVDMEDIMNLNENMAKHIWKEVKGVDLKEFPRMTFKEAMDRFGSDKPDIRFGMELQNLLSAVTGHGFNVFDSIDESKGQALRGICVPGGGVFSRGKFDKLTDLAKKNGVKGLVWMKWEESDKVGSPVGKFFSDEVIKDIIQKAGGAKGDAVLLVADRWENACNAAGALRLSLGKELELIDNSEDRFLWVTEFPLFEYDDEEERFVARHHPFTAPVESQKDVLSKGDKDKFHDLNAKAYDLVCNGHELGGGSVRIHRNDMQSSMFAALGMSEEEVIKQFGFFVEALKYGTPPHAGMAWGLDRLVMILAGTDAIREVIAFPKTTQATDLMSGAPSTVSDQQLSEVGLRLK
jgi:aspartyl-tRNA synthetase